MPGLKERVVRALASSEAFLSPTEWDMKNHNLIHLVEQIVALGKPQTIQVDLAKYSQSPFPQHCVGCDP